jgi:toxin-antitoxin system PIN domain toxin
MILVDVNVLVYAHRQDAPNHRSFLKWLEDAMNSQQAYGFSEHILSSFIRVVTHPRVFNPPSTPASAFAFANELRDQPNAIPIMPGNRHWSIFQQLCLSASSKGNLIPDAYFAALAIESGSEWITTDRDYSRFHGLSWRHPLEG